MNKSVRLSSDIGEEGRVGGGWDEVGWGVGVGRRGVECDSGGKGWGDAATDRVRGT